MSPTLPIVRLFFRFLLSNQHDYFPRGNCDVVFCGNNPWFVVVVAKNLPSKKIIVLLSVGDSPFLLSYKQFVFRCYFCKIITHFVHKYRVKLHPNIQTLGQVIQKVTFAVVWAKSVTHHCEVLGHSVVM